MLSQHGDKTVKDEMTMFLSLILKVSSLSVRRAAKRTTDQQQNKYNRDCIHKVEATGKRPRAYNNIGLPSLKLHHTNWLALSASQLAKRAPPLGTCRQHANLSGMKINRKHTNFLGSTEDAQGAKQMLRRHAFDE